MSTQKKPMCERRVLVTAGSTWTKIDDVRVITNVFTGNTGIAIARHFAEMGVDTTLLYNPKINRVRPEPGMTVQHYVTYGDLMAKMQEEIESGDYDIVVHSAAVSDYGAEVSCLAEVDDPAVSALFEDGVRVFHTIGEKPGKISSAFPSMTLSMTKTQKIVDLVKIWQPGIFLVKFKLEVGQTYDDLMAVAENSRRASHADLIVANDLRGRANGIPSAVILGSDEPREVEKRKMLPTALYNVVQWELGKRG